MANQTEIEAHYDTLGTLHALRLQDDHDGFPDYTCAFYNGDFTKTLRQAQLDKHVWIFDGLNLGEDLTGKRLLDIGSGWGNMLYAVKKRGGEAIGFTLSSGQVEHCKKHGLNEIVKDYKTMTKDEYGIFDGIISIGAFEHFCSIDEFKAGKQEEIYRQFFRICSEHLNVGSRVYLQTMTWNGKTPDANALSLDAPKDSPEAILARMSYFYPGSWLPEGLEQIQRCAEAEGFKFIKTINGRLDYIETLDAWGRATPNIWKLKHLPKTLKALIILGWHYITDKDTRILMESFKRGDQGNVFKRGIMSHERMFYEKVQ